jgi:hypothetical protein
VRRVTEVTYLGTVHGTLAALRRMVARNRGTIVQVGSALAYRAIPLQSAYCAAKFAVRGFTDSLRTELMHDGLDVHVTMVQLPALNTPQFQWSRLRGFARHPHPCPRSSNPRSPPRASPSPRTRGAARCSSAARPRCWCGSTSSALGLATATSRALASTPSSPTDPSTPRRPDNLAEPLPGDYGAHGPLDSRARPRSLQLAVTRHHHAIGVGLALRAGAWATLWWKAR